MKQTIESLKIAQDALETALEILQVQLWAEIELCPAIQEIANANARVKEGLHWLNDAINSYTTTRR